MSKVPSDPADDYVYCITRLDLPQPHLSIQVGHALIAATKAYLPTISTHPNLIIVTVPDEPALEKAFNRLKEKGTPVAAWYEPDLGNTLTAIATGLLRGEQRQPLRHYPLLR